MFKHHLLIELHLQLVRKREKRVFIVTFLAPKTARVVVIEIRTLAMHVKYHCGAITVPELVETARTINAFKTMVPVRSHVKMDSGDPCAAIDVLIRDALLVAAILEDALSASQICGETTATWFVVRLVLRRKTRMFTATD